MPYNNWIDIIIVLTLGVYIFQGFRYGFARGMAEFAAFLVSTFAALNFYGIVTNILSTYFLIPSSFAKAFGFFTVWAGLMWIAVFVFLKLFNFLSAMLGKFLNKVLSIIPSVANGLITVAVILTFVVALPISAGIKQDILSSEIGGFLVRKTLSYEHVLGNIFGEAIQESLTFLTVNPEESKSIDLGYKLENPSTNIDAEEKMFVLVNEERIKAGLKPLVKDDAIRDVARRHSLDMFQRGYFSHVTPDGKNLADRLKEGNIIYMFAGENLALAPDTDLAMEGLMKSPGHRKNILSDGFRKIGVGVMDGGDRGLMFTQNFTD